MRLLTVVLKTKKGRGETSSRELDGIIQTIWYIDKTLLICLKASQTTTKSSIHKLPPLYGWTCKS